MSFTGYFSFFPQCIWFTTSPSFLKIGYAHVWLQIGAHTYYSIEEVTSIE